MEEEKFEFPENRKTKKTSFHPGIEPAIARLAQWLNIYIYTMNITFILFLIGILGFVLNRKNIILMLISIEIIVLLGIFSKKNQAVL